MALNEIHAILKRTRYGTGSQWSDLSNGAEGVRSNTFAVACNYLFSHSAQCRCNRQTDGQHYHAK